jgi:hypothetical protein
LAAAAAVLDDVTEQKVLPTTKELQFYGQVYFRPSIRPARAKSKEIKFSEATAH